MTHTTDQLCLPSPYGYGSGVHITLFTECILDELQLIEVLKQYSCYPNAIPKIINSLKYCGRYDCSLQHVWFLHQRINVILALSRVGVGLKINSTPTDVEYWSWNYDDNRRDIMRNCCIVFIDNKNANN